MTTLNIHKRVEGEIKPCPVEIKRVVEREGLVFFLHRNPAGTKWRWSETRSGASILDVSYRTALNELEEFIAEYEEGNGKESFAKTFKRRSKRLVSKYGVANL